MPSPTLDSKLEILSGGGVAGKSGLSKARQTVSSMNRAIQ